MVGSSKILTVSYGTFSCTLEGFDDSFSTMKAIAEYFRDLAADDRYFGAEPPKPDAEMLARIAEREIARRVEARTEGTGIVLKAGQALSASEAVSLPAAEAASEPETAEAAETAPLEEDVAPEVSVDETPANDTGTTDLAEEAEDAVDVAEDDAAHAELASDEDDADEIAFDALEIISSDEEDEDTDPFDYEVDASELAESLAARPTPHRVVPTRVMPPAQDDPTDGAKDEATIASALPPVVSAPPVHPDSESVAAKLERIRAVVGKAKVSEPEVENEHASETPVAQADLAPSFEDDEPETVDTAAIADEPTTEEASEKAADEPAAPVARSAHAQRPVRTRVIKMSLADFQRKVQEGRIEEETSTEEESIASEPASEEPVAAKEVAETPTVADWSEDEDLSEFGGEDISDEDIADLAALDGSSSEDLAETSAEFDEDDARLSDEEEAELLAELAELQRDEDVEPGVELRNAPVSEMKAGEEDFAEELSGEPEQGDIADDEWDDEDEAEATHQVAHTDSEDDEEDAHLNLFGGSDDDEDEDDLDPENAILSADDDEDDAQDSRALRRQKAFETSPDEDSEVLSRLIEQTDDQFNHPDTNRRRESITQLKAAVAATEAARQMGEPDRKDPESADEFRNDLRQAVRPRRPTRPTERPVTRTERPQTAPLKLVASQRVDIVTDAEQEDSPSDPVRPRRVRLDEAGPAEVAREAGSFEAFARDMGAQGLAELLEAAAAYTAYVEGSEDFSRPQLMSKVRGLTDRDFSREEGLRSFGTLLREGRIMKVRNGRFQVSEETRFHPERRVG